MANNYTQFSFQFFAPEEAHDWIKSYLEQIGQFSEWATCHEEDANKPKSDDWFLQSIVDEYDGYVDLDVGLSVEGGQTVVWCLSEESSNVEQTASFVQRILQQFDLGPVKFTYSYTCSRMRVDEFGGGGVVVTKDEIFFKDAAMWCNDKLEDLERAK